MNVLGMCISKRIPYVLYMACLYTSHDFWHRGRFIFIFQRGLCVACSTDSGNAKASFHRTSRERVSTLFSLSCVFKARLT